MGSPGSQPSQEGESEPENRDPHWWHFTRSGRLRNAAAVVVGTGVVDVVALVALVLEVEVVEKSGIQLKIWNLI